MCLASWAAYLLNRFAIKPWLGPGNVFMHGHFNDALLMPSALPPLLGLHRWLRVRDNDGKPTAGELVGHLLFWSFFFEFYGPRYLHHSTGDWGDVASYWIGGLLAWLAWSWLYGTAPVLVNPAAERPEQPAVLPASPPVIPPTLEARADSGRSLS